MASLLVLPRYKGEYNRIPGIAQVDLVVSLPRLLVGKSLQQTPADHPSQLCLTLPPRWLGSSMLGGEIKESWWEFSGSCYMLVSELDS